MNLPMNQYPGSGQNPYRREHTNKHGELLRFGMAVIMSFRSKPPFGRRGQCVYQFVRCYQFTGSNIARPGTTMVVLQSATGRTYRVSANLIHPFSFAWFK